jgi:hypothetical protein
VAAGTLAAGEFDLQVAKIIPSTGKEIDISLSILSLTIYEDINEFSLIGELAIQDSMNLASYAPLIGQEYLKLKIATPTIDTEDRIIDFTENPFMITTVDSREDTGRGTQQTYLSFVSREFIVNQRKKVTRTLTGTYGQIVNNLVVNDLESKKRYYAEPSAENKKFVASNESPFAIIDKAMRQAVSLKFQDPTFLFYETLRGFNFRTIGNLYAQAPLMDYEKIVSGTKTKKGAVDIEKDYRSILNYTISGAPDTVHNYKEGMYASELLVHNITSKNYQKHTYNYINSFNNERHIEVGPLVNTLSITKDGKNVSSFPAKTFLAPVSSMGSGDSTDSSFEDSFNNHPYTSSTPERHIQQRNSNLGMLETGLSINLLVHGHTTMVCGDVVECNLPYTAGTKTKNEEKYDNLYKGSFLISKIRHDFNFFNKRYEMGLQLQKDSIPKVIFAPTDNPEPTADKPDTSHSDMWAVMAGINNVR